MEKNNKNFDDFDTEQQSDEIYDEFAQDDVFTKHPLDNNYIPDVGDEYDREIAFDKEYSDIPDEDFDDMFDDDDEDFEENEGE